MIEPFSILKGLLILQTLFIEISGLACRSSRRNDPCPPSGSGWFYDDELGDCRRLTDHICVLAESKFDNYEKCVLHCVSPFAETTAAKSKIPPGPSRSGIPPVEERSGNLLTGAARLGIPPGEARSGNQPVQTISDLQHGATRPSFPPEEARSEIPSGSARSKILAVEAKSGFLSRHVLNGSLSGAARKFAQDGRKPIASLEESEMVSSKLYSTPRMSDKIYQGLLNKNSITGVKVGVGLRGSTTRIPGTSVPAVSADKRHNVKPKKNSKEFIMFRSNCPSDQYPCDQVDLRRAEVANLEEPMSIGDLPMPTIMIDNPTVRATVRVHEVPQCTMEGNHPSVCKHIHYHLQHRDRAVCTLPEDRGPCDLIRPMWRFSGGDGGCIRFMYGGCGGNGNLFLSKFACERFCKSQTEIVPNNAPECLLPPEPGPCSNYSSAWFHDHSERQCFVFRYSGCGGNKNRFESRKDCENRCRSISPKSEGSFDNSAAFGRYNYPDNSYTNSNLDQKIRSEKERNNNVNVIQNKIFIDNNWHTGVSHTNSMSSLNINDDHPSMSKAKIETTASHDGFQNAMVLGIEPNGSNLNGDEFVEKQDKDFKNESKKKNELYNPNNDNEEKNKIKLNQSSRRTRKFKQKSLEYGKLSSAPIEQWRRKSNRFSFW